MTKKQLSRPLPWIAIAATLSACVSVVTPKESFVTSSLSRNRGKPHVARLQDQAIEQVVDRLIALAKQRELTLVKQSDCGQHRCELALRSKPVDRRIFRSTQSLVLSYYSRYFISLRRQRSQVKLFAVGVPVLGGEMSCPDYLKNKVGCKVAELNRGRGQNLVASVQQDWGYDISGAVEAETLEGLLAELRRPHLGAETPVAPRARARPAIVAVFDIEDRSGRIRPSTLGQLTDYLAAKVTQTAGYQVIPRDQLRSRLAAEKRRSYKECFDQRCQIELGKAVAAEKSLATKLLRVGSQCALTSLLYDLKTEATDRAASVKTACTEEALLNGVEQLARQLAGRDAGPIPQ